MDLRLLLVVPLFSCVMEVDPDDELPELPYVADEGEPRTELPPDPDDDPPDLGPDPDALDEREELPASELAPEELDDSDDEPQLLTAEVAMATSGCWDFGKGGIGRGIRYLNFRNYEWEGGRHVIHAVRIKNDDPHVLRYRVNQRRALHTTAEFGKLNARTRVAINGDFGTTDHDSRGLWKSRGEVEHHDNSHAYLAFGLKGTDGMIPSAWRRQGHDPVRAEDTPGRAAVAGHPELVRDGHLTAPADCDGTDLCSGRHPRTATGFSHDRTYTYLVVVEGRMAGAAGMTTRQLGRLMKNKVCADDAINHDGGGSSTLWIRSRGVVNRCSDGGGATGGAGCRNLVNHLGVVWKKHP